MIRKRHEDHVEVRRRLAQDTNERYSIAGLYIVPTPNLKKVKMRISLSKSEQRVFRCESRPAVEEM